ncbi:MAG: type II secretion system protein [Bdellovibrio sp.]
MKTMGPMNSLNTNKGFSLVMALVAIGILACITMGIATLFNSFNAQTRHFKSEAGARALISTLQGIIAYRNLCTANLDPSTSVFNATTAALAAPNAMPLAIQLGGAPAPTVQAGSLLQNFDVTVSYFQIQNAALVGADPVTGYPLYSGELALSLNKLASTPTGVAGGTQMNVRGIGTIFLAVTPGTNVIAGCWALPNAQQACNQIGGTYNGAAVPPTPRCSIPYPCGNNSIFVGYVGNVAQCRTINQLVGQACPTINQTLYSDGAGGAYCM